MNNIVTINIEKTFQELKRFKYMMHWYKKSKNSKTKIKIAKHCVKIANNFCNGKYKWKVKVLKN